MGAKLEKDDTIKAASIDSKGRPFVHSWREPGHANVRATGHIEDMGVPDFFGGTLLVSLL